MMQHHQLRLLVILAAILLPSTLGGIVLRDNIPDNFVAVDLLKGACNIDYSRKHIGVIFGLQQRNLDQLEAILWDVSTPSSENYGAHLGFDELHDLIEPHPDEVQKIHQWLISNGVDKNEISRHEARDHLRANMTIQVAERLFNTKYQLYADMSGDTHWLKTSKYEIPDNLGIRAVFSRARMNIEKRCKRQIRAKATENTKSVRSETESEPMRRATRTVTESRLAADIAKTNAPFPYLVWGRYQEVILRCPDGSFADTTLKCGNGDYFQTLVMSTYNYYTRQHLQTDTFVLYFSQPCDTGNNCAFTLQSLGQNSTGASHVGETSYPNSVPSFTPYYFVYYGITANGTRTQNLTLDYMPIADSSNINASEIRQAYGIPVGYSGSHPNNSQGVIEFGNGFYSPSDLQQYFQTEGLPDYSSKVISTGTPNCPCEAPSGEAQLDIEVIMAMGQNITTYFYEDDFGDEDWLTRAMNLPEGFALVQSVSYGFGDEDPVATAYYSTEFMKAGARGVSVLFATGDQGQWTSGIGNPYNPSPPSVSNPVSSPYVTAVGGTMAALTSTGKLGEWLCTTALGSFFSAGSGISLYEPRPWYQNASVANYLKNYAGNVPASYDTSKRAFPDISGFSLNIETVIQGSVGGTSGTSASTPIVAGIIALLNDIRLNNNQPPLGFLNPLLYALPDDAFNDITVGDNACIPGYCAPYGFPTAPGYDIPSGRGSINFPVMANYIRLLSKNSSASATASVASTSLASTTSSSASIGVASTSSASTSATTASSFSTAQASSSSATITVASSASTSKATTTGIASTSAASVASTSTSSTSSKATTTGQTTTSAASVASTSKASTSSKATTTGQAVTSTASVASTSTSSASTKATSIAASTSSSRSTATSQASTSSTSSASVASTIATTTASKLSTTSASSAAKLSSTSTGLATKLSTSSSSTASSASTAASGSSTTSLTTSSSGVNV